MTVEILGKVAGVLRRCADCGELRAIELYHQYDNNRQVVGTGKVCLVCRACIALNAAEYERTIGAADWGESQP